MTARTADAGAVRFPDWVPVHVRHYLVHTELGLSIRSLARQADCHASTVLRQVRRNEGRRDDPLIDRAFCRLAETARGLATVKNKDCAAMKMEKRIQRPDWPDDDTIQSEAQRVLRRLAEPEAVLALAPGMDKAVVVREMPDGRSVRSAVLDAQVAEAFALKDWIAGEARGRVLRYRLTHAGRAAVKRMAAEAAARGFAEAPSPFAEQHRSYAGTVGGGTGAGGGRRRRYNTNESPLTTLARRRDADGRPFLTPDLVTAGERLREDFELAQMGPRVTQNWERFLTSGDRGNLGCGSGGGGGSDRARDRVAAALRDLGPGLGDVAMRCCCFLEGMEQAEKRMGWSARSGKIVLKIALQRLARHYDGRGAQADMIG